MEERESVEGREKSRSITPGESLDLETGSSTDVSIPPEESTQRVRRDSPQTIISTPVRRYLAGKSTMGAATSSGAEWDPNVTPASRDRAHQGQSVSRRPFKIRILADPGRLQKLDHLLEPFSTPPQASSIFSSPSTCSPHVEQVAVFEDCALPDEEDEWYSNPSTSVLSSPDNKQGGHASRHALFGQGGERGLNQLRRSSITGASKRLKEDLRKYQFPRMTHPEQIAKGGGRDDGGCRGRDEGGKEYVDGFESLKMHDNTTAPGELVSSVKLGLSDDRCSSCGTKPETTFIALVRPSYPDSLAYY
jgi:hypothetical protein